MYSRGPAAGRLLLLSIPPAAPPPAQWNALEKSLLPSLGPPHTRSDNAPTGWHAGSTPHSSDADYRIPVRSLPALAPPAARTAPALVLLPVLGLCRSTAPESVSAPAPTAHPDFRSAFADRVPPLPATAPAARPSPPPCRARTDRCCTRCCHECPTARPSVRAAAAGSASSRT